MIMEKVLSAAQPYLAGKTVRDLVVGITLIGCQLDSGDIGVSYVLHEELPHGCSAFPFVQEAVGKTALEIAEWSVSGQSCLQRSVAASVLAAAACQQDLPDDSEDRPLGIDFKHSDRVCMIGLIRPLAEQISKWVKEMIVFDKGLSMCGNDSMIYPMDRQPELIPTCDVVIISGTTTINHSIDGLLDMCGKAREVVMVGPSTPMFPEGWKGSQLTRLAGSCWNKNHKDQIFQSISRAGGISHMREFMYKKAVAIK
jgi:uncharacterized protein (DUF4213/DUF364 family)